MPDTKITALTALTAADPANDVLPIVDVSDTTMAASGTTKKISINNVLGCSGTATLASATITGNLTVDTNTLFVDSANDRVGIGTASPAQFVHLSKSNTSTALTAPPVGGASLRIQNSSSTNNNFGSVEFYNAAGLFGGSVNCQFTNQATPTNDLVFVTRGSSGGLEHYRIAADGVCTWSEVGGVAGTAMTLNSTGLGVGVSPSYKLSVAGTANIGTVGTAGRSLLIASSAADNITIEQTNNGSGNHTFDIKTPGWTTDSFNVYSGSTKRFTVTGDGNLGIGVTPSGTIYSSSETRFVVKGTATSYAGTVAVQSKGTTNAVTGFLTAGDGVNEVAIGSVTNSPINFYTNNAYKASLDASGNLLVGTTGLNGSWNTKLTLSNDSGTTKWAVGPYLGGVTNFLISAGASAGVYLNGTAATSWTSASDERLKDIIEPISNAIAKVGSLRAVIGKFKFDQNNTRKPFLIAQDIQSVLPEAVDASNPEKLGVAYTDVIPLLVAAIKELTAEVNALKNA